MSMTNPGQFLTKAQRRSGVIVGLFLPQEQAERLVSITAAAGVWPVEEPADLHVTLLYLGDRDALAPFREAIIETIRIFASMTPAISGTVGGVGRFNTEDDGRHPVYAVLDSVALEPMRAALLGIGRIIPIHQHHGFSPHITLAYIPTDRTTPTIDLDKMPLVFPALTLVWGDERITFPFAPLPTAADAMDETKAKYDAKAGETIAGNLVRGNDGKFTSGGSPSAKPRTRTSIGAARAQQKVPVVKAGKGKGRKKTAKKGTGKGRASSAAQRAAERAQRAAQRKAEQAARADQRNQDKIKREGARIAKQSISAANRKKREQDAAARLAERERMRAERTAAKKPAAGGGSKGGGGKGNPEKPDKAAQAVANRAKVATALKVDLDSLAALADGGELDEAAIGMLTDAGLARDTGAGPAITPAGRMLLRAAERGDERAARELIIRAREMKQRATERAAKRARTRTKGQTASDRAMFARMGATGGLRARGPDGARTGDKLPPKGTGIPRKGDKKPDKPAEPAAVRKLAALRTQAQDLSRQTNDLYGRYSKLLDQDLSLGPSWGQKLKPRYQKQVDAQRADLQRQAESLRQQVQASRRQEERAWAAVRKVEQRAERAAQTGTPSWWTSKEQAAPPPPLTVVKQANGRYRWFLRTTSAWRDKDGQWLTVKGLRQAVDFNNFTGNHGPLRWWHLGTTNDQRVSQGLPPQPVLDIGDCDTSMMIGPYLYESGTFRNEAIGAELAKCTDDLGASPGFRHWDGPAGLMPGHVFDDFILRERSLLPAAVASNHFTAAIVAHGG